MSDVIKHECGVALLRLLKPLDFYQKKYGTRDYRGGGRSSARETAMRVAAGAIARKVLDLKIGNKI